MWDRGLKIIVAIIYKYLKYNITLFTNINIVIVKENNKIKIPYMRQS
jgi:hypothetical protein